ncbi:MAG: (d)CMP kinase [Loktanella sp.]|nr:(d)CMP kinase [Loktanella sp.]
MSFTVAIDGPAAAGKGTISKAVAAHFGFAHLDTGLLYRAVGAGMLKGGDPVAVAQNLDPAEMDASTLRSAEVAQAASQVAVNPQVRDALTAFQRSFAARPEGAVLDGRDIGTVICPGAQVKLFVTASAPRRAERRYAELCESGSDTTLDAVLADVQARDARDAGRTTAPLAAAADAVLIDTSDMTIAQAVAEAIAVIEQVQKTLRD